MTTMWIWIIVMAALVAVAMRVVVGYPASNRHFRILLRPEVEFLSGVSEAMFPVARFAVQVHHRDDHDASGAGCKDDTVGNCPEEAAPGAPG